MTTAFGVFGMLVGGAIALVAWNVLRQLRRRRARGRGWVRTTGRITSLGREPSGPEQRVTTVVHYRYDDPQGRPVDGVDEFGAVGEGGPGDPVPVAYDPADPTRSVLAFDGAGVGASYLVGGVLLVVGPAMFMLGLLYLVRG